MCVLLFHVFHTRYYDYHHHSSCVTRQHVLKPYIAAVAAAVEREVERMERAKKEREKELRAGFYSNAHRPTAIVSVRLGFRLRWAWPCTKVEVEASRP